MAERSQPDLPAQAHDARISTLETTHGSFCVGLTDRVQLRANINNCGHPSRPSAAMHVRQRLAIMSAVTYHYGMARRDKPLVWLRGEVKTPPFSSAARVEAGALLRRLQRGESLGMPHVRPMPSIGRRCYELRILDANRSWRIIYRLDTDAIVIANVFPKTTRTTPRRVLEECQRRLRAYDRATEPE